VIVYVFLDKKKKVYNFTYITAEGGGGEIMIK